MAGIRHYMWWYILRRIIMFPITLWVIYTITFLMAVTIPGNPFKTGDRSLHPDVERLLKMQYDADNPVRFYRKYLTGLIQPVPAIKGEGPLINLGPSWQYRDWTCNQIIAASLPVSVTLGFVAILIAVAVGVPVGVISAVKRNSWFDYASLAVALVGISLPTFVTGTALLIWFALWLDVLPVGGWGRLEQLWLPAITLSLPFMAYIARLMRLGMLDIVSADYIRTARAKGLSQRVVIWKHALKNAFLPVLSFLGPATAAALTGSFVIESIFNIPGLGQHFVAAVQNRDRTLILATVLVYSAIIIFFNLVVDVLYAFVDPRIDLEAET